MADQRAAFVSTSSASCQNGKLYYYLGHDQSSLTAASEDAKKEESVFRAGTTNVPRHARTTSRVALDSSKKNCYNQRYYGIRCPYVSSSNNSTIIMIIIIQLVKAYWENWFAAADNAEKVGKTRKNDRKYYWRTKPICYTCTLINKYSTNYICTY
jgi:hypothetical protein